MEIDVFISHSSRNSDVAASLIDLLCDGCNIPRNKVRCTSVDGYRLPAGANTNELLRLEVKEARFFIGLITPQSIQSPYVLFELGARWGSGLPFAPVLASGANSSLLEGPLKGFNALDSSSEDQMYQLVHDVALVLGCAENPPSIYHRRVKEIARISVPSEQPVNP